MHILQAGAVNVTKLGFMFASRFICFNQFNECQIVIEHVVIRRIFM